MEGAADSLVFISAKRNDYAPAEKIFELLVQNGVQAFFGRRSLPELGNSDYRRVIDDKLDQCTHMIVVASSRENAESPWVEAEWGFFINAKRSGEKTGNLITVTVGDLQPRQLPPSLRYYEVIPFDPGRHEVILRYVDAPDRDQSALVGADTSEETELRLGSAAFPAPEIPLTVECENGNTSPALLQYEVKIKVIGIGGAGLNIVDQVSGQRSRELVTVAINTDAQALNSSIADFTVQIGVKRTRGLGSGGDPRIGRESAEEDVDAIRQVLTDSDMILLSAGLGGGVGSGATPVIARQARSLGIITVCVASTPFDFEGGTRREQAKAVVAELLEVCDVVVTIPNQMLLGMVSPGESLTAAFQRVDTIHLRCLRSIYDVVHTRGFVNVDFADLRALLRGSGRGYIGLGEAAGPERAVTAAEQAVTTGFLSPRGLGEARAVMVNVTGGRGFNVSEVQAAIERANAEVGAGAQVLFGAVEDNSLDDALTVTVLAAKYD